GSNRTITGPDRLKPVFTFSN
ncbi:hypothetical protein CP09DC78_1128B, partial [Chlamydia psittaci 09DC78]